MGDVTQILSQINDGDQQAANELLPLVYNELRRLAAAKMAREQPGQTLQPTALVHEAYLNLVSGEEAASYNDRGHFFAVAATAMRRILVDKARAKLRLKRGGERERLPLTDVASELPDEQMLALHDALEILQEKDPVKARLVELRYFAGMTIDEAAEVLEIPPRTADRYWTFARAWLQTEVLSD